MTDLQDRVADYLGSEHFFLLDPDLKPDAENLLLHFLQAAQRSSSDFPSLARPQLFLQVLTDDMAGLDLSLSVRRKLPNLLEAFFDFLYSTGMQPDASTWSDWMPGVTRQYLDRLRPDGKVRGQTLRHSVEAVGRNDPCPCGSGKKFKKCCMPR
jgi:hypothetical protein